MTCRLQNSQKSKFATEPDFALRTRHTDGTVLLDLERRRPLALLLDREAAAVAQWLPAHPGGEVRMWDRAEAYAEAARLGALLARQVADRCHLLQNLADGLTDVFRAHAPQLAQLKAQHLTAPTPVHNAACPASASSIPAPASTPSADGSGLSTPPCMRDACTSSAPWRGKRRSRACCFDLKASSSATTA